MNIERYLQKAIGEAGDQVPFLLSAAVPANLTWDFLHFFPRLDFRNGIEQLDWKEVTELPGALNVSNSPHMTPILLTHYDCFLDDHDGLRYGQRVSKHYTIGTLHRLARYGDRYRRRAAMLAIGILGDYDSNPIMGCGLVDRDRGVRMLAEDGIRTIWQRAGTPQQRQRLQLVMQLNATGPHDQVVSIGSDLVEQAPWFAEAWNQRAIGYFRLQQYTDSIRDCQQTLEINPYHFGAASGMGQCYAKLKDPISALECFRRALRLNPSLEGIRMKVVSLQRSLKDS